MKKLYGWYRSLRYAGLNEEEMKMCIPEVKKRNVVSMGWVLEMILVVLIILTLVSLIPGSGEETNRVLYIVFTILIGVQYVLYLGIFKRKPEWIVVSSYMFMFTAYSFGIYEAVGLGADSTSTVFCVFLVAVPMFVIDRPLRLINLTFINEGLLLATYFIVGNQLGDPFVVINSLSCTLLGICCATSIQKTKFSDIRNHLMLEVQRDTDMMTGACSRVAYLRDISVMSDNGLSAGVIFADVNGLKKANDTFGHEAGDRLIRNAFAKMLEYFNQPNDRIYRIGGDEFVIISLAEEKDAFYTRYYNLSADVSDPKIISCGATWLESVSDAESAIKEAEKLMYADKAQYYKDHPDMDRRMR